MTVHFIGAGPGAADLLTVRAVRLLQGSPVCLYAGTYVDAVLAHCPPDAELVDTQHLNLDEITATLVRAHAEGKDVARLCSGDPSVYSAVAEQARDSVSAIELTTGKELWRTPVAPNPRRRAGAASRPGGRPLGRHPRRPRVCRHGRPGRP